MTRLILIVAWVWVQGLGVVFAEQGEGQGSTHPASYTTVHEIRRDGGRTPIQLTVSEIDDRSLIAISFDETKMRKPDNGRTRVKIRVEAFQTKDGDRDRIAPIDNYVSRQADDESDEDISNFRYHDRPYDPDNGKHVPNTIIDPSRLTEEDVDQIEILISNRKTRERVVFYLRLREFGLRTRMTDTFMFFKRIGGGQGEGVDTVNFSPAAGATFGTTWLTRDHKFINALRPRTRSEHFHPELERPRLERVEAERWTGGAVLPVQQCFGVHLWGQLTGRTARLVLRHWDQLHPVERGDLRVAHKVVIRAPHDPTSS